MSYCALEFSNAIMLMYEMNCETNEMKPPKGLINQWCNLQIHNLASGVDIMDKKLLLLFGLLLFLGPALAGCLGSSTETGGSDDYTLEDSSGEFDVNTGYANDGDAGETFSYQIHEAGVTSVSFILTWSDDHPSDTQDEFTLTVSGTAQGESVTQSESGTSGSLSVTVNTDAQGDDFDPNSPDSTLGQTWTVDVSVANCGDYPFNPNLPGIIFTNPDEGNDFSLSGGFKNTIKVGGDGAASGIAPDFTVTTTDGNTFKLSDQTGNVVLIDTMATWCSTCKKINPELIKIWDKYGNDPKFVMISIDVDATESNSQLKAYMDDHGVHWPHAIDTGGMAAKYNVVEIPSIFIIDINGQNTFRNVGMISADTLESEIESAKIGGGTGLFFGDQNLMLAAFIGGAFTFFAPCALPLLPGYLGFYFSRKDDEEDGEGEGKKADEDGETTQPKTPSRGATLKRGLFGGIAAGLGVVVLFFFVGLLAGVGGALITPYISYIGPFVGLFIVVFGFLMYYDVTLPTYKVSVPINRAVKGITSKVSGGREMNSFHAGLFKYGMGYGAASTGCGAPVFLSLLITAVASGGFLAGFGVLLFFGFGMGTLMVIVTIMLSGAKGAMVGALNKWTPTLRKVGGAVMIMAGVFLMLTLFVAIDALVMFGLMAIVAIVMIWLEKKKMAELDSLTEN